MLPQWGGWPIGRIAHSDVAGWVGDLASSGLSAGSVRKIYLVASLVLDGAAQDGRITRNPAKGVRLPRQVRREPRFLTPEELSRLVGAAGSHGLVIAVLRLTGLRFGSSPPSRCPGSMSSDDG